MIAQPVFGNFLKGLIQYNEDKKKTNHSQLLYINTLNHDMNEFKSYYQSSRAEKYHANDNDLLHISLSFSPDDQDKITDDFYRKITHEFLLLNKFPSNQPYIVYKHTDKNHPHIHIGIPTLKTDGTKFTNDGRPIMQMIKICRALEKKYNLTRALAKTNTSTTLSDTELKPILIHSISTLLKNKKFTSLDVFKKQLQSLPITYLGNQATITIHERTSKQTQEVTGYAFYLKDSFGKQLTKPIKLSSLPVPSLKGLIGKFERNLKQKKHSMPDFEKALHPALMSYLKTTETKDLHSFKHYFDQHKIQIKFHEGTKGIYGVTFSDAQHNEYNGSELTGIAKTLKLKSLSIAELNKLFARSNTTIPVDTKKTAEHKTFYETTQSKTPKTQKPMSNLKVNFDELKKEYSIINIAQDQFGFKINKEKSTAHCKVIVKESTTYLVYKRDNGTEYFIDANDNSIKGSILDFLVKEQNYSSLYEAAKALQNFPKGISIVQSSKTTTSEDHSFSFKPIPGRPVVNEKNDFGVFYQFIPFSILRTYFSNYVSQISTEELKLELNKRYGEYAQSVFSFTDDNTNYHLLPLFNLQNHTVAGQEIRGHGAKHFVKGTQKSNSAWYVFNTQSSNYVVCESPYKCMAYHTLQELHQEKHQPANYIATGGTPSVALLEYFASLHGTGKSLELGLDNDRGGVKHTAAIINYLIKDKNQTTISHRFLSDQVLTDIQFATSFLHTQFLAYFSAFKEFKISDEKNHQLKIICDEKHVSLLQEKLIEFHNLRLKITKPQHKDFNDDLKHFNANQQVVNEKLHQELKEMQSYSEQLQTEEKSKKRIRRSL